MTLPDFEAAELDEFIDQRKLRWIYINGEMRFCSNFFRTLCKANPAFSDRAGVKLFGVESLVKKGLSKEEWINKADIKLYEGKRSGKNKILM